MSDTTHILRDGFQVRDEAFLLPADLSGLDFATQRDLNICNLFVNRKFTISDIMRLAEEDYRTVVQSLLRQKVIVDRRHEERLQLGATESRRPNSA